MRVHAAVAVATLLLGTPAAAFQQPTPAPRPCAAPLKGPGKALAFRGALPESERKSLSAGIYLALTDSSGGAAWPLPQIEAAPACPVASFEADDLTWSISGGVGEAPPRWIRAPGREEYFFVARGPGLEDAKAWSAARTPSLGLKGPPAYYLSGSANGAHFVFRVYDGAPDSRQIADDLVAVIAGRALPLAMYDPEGDAVSLYLPTESGRTAELFRPGQVYGGRSATLHGPDGLFFAPVPLGVTMRGSGLLCADRYGAFSRTRLLVLDTRDQALDLGCRLETDESWITVFSTRRPDVSNDKALFAQRIKQAQADDGVSGQTSNLRPGETATLRAGKAWIDKAGVGQGLWFIRRGEYVIEVRATFEKDAADGVFKTLGTLLLNAAPGEPASEGPV